MKDALLDLADHQKSLKSGPVGMSSEPCRAGCALSIVAGAFGLIVGVLGVVLHVYGIVVEAGPAGAESPVGPITLGGVEVDVSQEEVCSPRRVNLVYAPLATWYNATERAALRAAGRLDRYCELAEQDTLNYMLAQRPDVRDAMIKSGSRMIVMAHDEYTTDVPEHAHLKPKEYWDADHTRRWLFWFWFV